MSGSKIGGQKARDTNIAKFGLNFYAKIGAMGGAVGRTGGFASPRVGKDGLTGRERASVVGKKGGEVSRRPSKLTKG